MDSVVNQYLGTVKPMHEQFVEPKLILKYPINPLYSVHHPMKKALPFLSFIIFQKFKFLSFFVQFLSHSFFHSLFVF